MQARESANETLYAGRVCPRCKKGINSEIPDLKYKSTIEKHKKRYGDNICNDCAKELTN